MVKTTHLSGYMQRITPCKPNTEYATQHEFEAVWLDEDMNEISYVSFSQMPTLSYRIHSPKNAKFMKVIGAK